MLTPPKAGNRRWVPPVERVRCLPWRELCRLLAVPALALVLPGAVQLQAQSADYLEAKERYERKEYLLAMLAAQKAVAAGRRERRLPALVRHDAPAAQSVQRRRTRTAQGPGSGPLQSRLPLRRGGSHTPAAKRDRGPDRSHGDGRPKHHQPAGARGHPAPGKSAGTGPPITSRPGCTWDGPTISRT